MPFRHVIVVVGFLTIGAPVLWPETGGTAFVRHAPMINGTVAGSLQVMSGEAVTLNSSSKVSGNLLVPGMPNVVINGRPSYGGRLVGAGSSSPSGYSITLNSGSVLGHLVVRTDALPLTAVSAPISPTGTRAVTINSPSNSLGSFTTLRDLTLNSNVGQFAIPAGISHVSVLRIGFDGQRPT
jgi:hypothetical protein